MSLSLLLLLWATVPKAQIETTDEHATDLVQRFLLSGRFSLAERFDARKNDLVTLSWRPGPENRLVKATPTIVIAGDFAMTLREASEYFREKRQCACQPAREAPDLRGVPYAEYFLPDIAFPEEGRVEVRSVHVQVEFALGAPGAATRTGRIAVVPVQHTGFDSGWRVAAVEVAASGKAGKPGS